MAHNCRCYSKLIMAESRFDRWLSPWVFVATGIVFNILSVLITHYFIGLNNDQINVIDLALLLDLSSAAQQWIIESINNSYFGALELLEQIMPLEGDNSLLFSIAIFLQVTGLILVLARDLRRN